MKETTQRGLQWVSAATASVTALSSLVGAGALGGAVSDKTAIIILLITNVASAFLQGLRKPKK